MNVWPFLLLLSLPAFAQELFFPSEVEFKPHMLHHLHEGCPTNAECSADYGKVRQVWRKSLEQLLINREVNVASTLERVRQEVGMPLSIWVKAAGAQDQSLSTWNSSCRRHNLETGEVFWGELMAKNLNDRNEQDQPFMYNRLALEHSGQARLMRTLRDSLPSMIIDDQLYFTYGEAGIYFGLLIDLQGELKIINPLTIEHQAREVPCPENLKAQLESWPHFSLVFERSYCRAIWDDTQKTWRTLAVGWAC
jgi:hypothetical protein